LRQGRTGGKEREGEKGGRVAEGRRWEEKVRKEKGGERRGGERDFRAFLQFQICHYTTIYSFLWYFKSNRSSFIVKYILFGAPPPQLGVRRRAAASLVS